MYIVCVYVYKCICTCICVYDSLQDLCTIMFTLLDLGSHPNVGGSDSVAQMPNKIDISLALYNTS